MEAEDLIWLEEARTRVLGIVGKAGLAMGSQAVVFRLPMNTETQHGGEAMDQTAVMESVMAGC